MREFIKIHPEDSVAVALKVLEKGTEVQIDGRSLILREEIPEGHKFALQNIAAGEQVFKYGNSIGTAREEILPGAWVHIHNVKTGLGEVLDYTFAPQELRMEKTEDACFQGYRRTNGKAGVRNEIWIIPTVGCVNSVAQAVEKKARKYVRGSVEAVAAFPHPYGCSQMGEDQEHTRQILADFVNHPNAGGVLVLGLGCENSNIEELKKYIGPYDGDAGQFQREPISVSELVIGMKCGGSDGLSGITANPAVGGFSDMLISKGGTTILTEVPEMFGAETLLMNRCRNEELFHQTVNLINENPSPGNKKGGITTLEDKSLGCTQKSGSAPVSGVLSYGEPVRAKGLNLLSAPGNDLVASTALAASGAHIVLFTTGRGTPFASPVPTVKIASNTPLARHKDNWIDFNCGTAAEESALEEVSEQLFSYVLQVASGQKVKAEEAGFHDMAIFKQGVTL